MWRNIGAALVAAAVLATPVLAIEALTPPATVPAKVNPVAQTKAKNSPKTVATVTTKGSAKTGVTTSSKAGTKINSAKKHQPAKVAGKSIAAKPIATKPVPAKPVAAKSLATKSPGNQISKKAGNKGKQIVATKPPSQHAKALTAKTKNSKAAEPVETTGSVAPRSVPMPGLY
jgi:hypothetical protein